MSNESLRSVERIKISNERETLEEKIALMQQRLTAEADQQKKEDMQIELSILEEDLETLRWSADSTGARKGNLFGVELREMLDDFGLQRNENGEIVCENEQGLESTQLITVNMGELDRLNESGEHALGDEGLSFAFKHINETIVALLRQRPGYEDLETASLLDKFKVYRTAGNDFTIIIKNSDEKLSRSIAQALTGNMELPKEMNQDAVPLAAASISLDGALELLKHIRTAQGHETASAENREAVESQDKTEMITLLKERLNTLGEVEKIQTRLKRIIDKIKNPQAGEQNGARDLYDKFLQKSLGGLLLEPGELGPQEYSIFLAALERNGLLAEGDEDVERKKMQRIFSVATDTALRQFQIYNQNTIDSERNLQKSVLSDVQERLSAEGLESQIQLKELQPAAKAEYGETEQQKVIEFQQRLEALGGNTEGGKILNDLREQLKSEQKRQPPNERAIALAQKRLDNELLKRDSLTGLKGRGLYYQNLDQRIAEGGSVSVIAIDMAFLKYFDKSGGKNTGDKAIVTAGIILDSISKKYAQYGVEAYRLGGDEFSISVYTDDKKILQAIIEDINDAAENQIGNIPVHEGATVDYRPESLQFNFGTAVYEASRHGTETLGLRDRKTPSDKLNHEADARIEVDKAVNRFMFLLQRSLQIARVQNPEEKRKAEAELDILFSYSEKAIFGKIGRDKIQEWTNEYQVGSTSLMQIMNELKTLIMERLQEKGKKEIQDMEVMHIMLENQMLLDFKEQEIDELKVEIIRLESQAANDNVSILNLKSQLQIAEQDRRAVLDLRQQMKEAA